MTDTRTLIARFERQAHRMGELWERCQGKGWPESESAEFTALRDERTPATRAALEAIESAATKPLLERIAELEAKLAQQASHVPEVHFGKTMMPETLRIELQKKCSAWGAYWRGADAHGVELTTDQAVELLENALNVEVEIKDEEVAQQAKAQEPRAWMWQHDETGMTGFVQNAPKDELLHWERMNKPRRIVAPLFTRPQPAQLTAGDDRRHVICLCPDCIKPKDAPTAVQGEQP